jgi:uncharacterized RDD family membrane protein YckC
MTEQQLSQDHIPDDSAEPLPEMWRNEVQSRIARYKTRRGRRVEGAFSMRFPFPVDEIVEPVETADEFAPISETREELPEVCLSSEAAAQWLQVAEPTQAALTDPADELVAEMDRGAADDDVPELELAPEPEPEPFVDRLPRPRPKRKVIAFPRHLSVAPETIYRLADPVTSESPRILDVPEELEAIPTAPFLDGLQLDPLNSADASRDREHVELPFRAVGVSQRVFAGLIDVAVAGVGVVVFGGVAYQILSKPPLTKPLLLALVVAAGLLWSVYQYLFVVYAGRTLGMMAAKIRLRTFRGKVPNLRQRRHRVLGFYLSALSLGMGLMWLFVDVDTLCWHDRLSRTYLADRES